MDNSIHGLIPNEVNINLLGNVPNQNVNIGATPSFSNVYLTNVPLDASQTDILTIDNSGILGYRVLPDFAALPVDSVLSTNGTGEVVGTALTNGQLLIGHTSNAPVASTLTREPLEIFLFQMEPV